MFNDKTTEALNKPLDPKHVRKPTGSFGPKGDYLEGWHVINELNRVFGFDGWSYTVLLSKESLERGKDSRGNEQWQAAYTCICTLTVGDTVRQDVGFGSGFAKQVGDAIEGATKEATTDSLKRAARTFGNIFGLALYDKSRENVQAPPVEKIGDADRDEIAAMASGAGVPLKKICETYSVPNLKELPADKADEVKRRIQQVIEDKKEKA